jgi:hypothetical protein
MIPASYMFKDIYHQQWEQEQTMPHAPEHHQSGVTTPAWHLMLALLHRRAKPGRHYFGVHAYD